MKIALIGYGKMGKEIEKVAINRGHTIAEKFDIHNPFDNEKLKGIDVAIEFTMPNLAVQHMQSCFESQVPIVVGTTGWNADLEMVKSDCKNKNATLFYSSNFSVGVNISFALNQLLAKWIAPFSEYQAKITEIHHTQKLDAPSGTAITFAEGIIANNKKYKQYQLQENETLPEGILPITALREDSVPGTHQVEFFSEIDTVEIKHTAHSRQGFALGAVLAAEFVVGKKGVFGMTDLLKFEQ